MEASEPTLPNDRHYFGDPSSRPYTEEYVVQTAELYVQARYLLMRDEGR